MRLSILSIAAALSTLVACNSQQAKNNGINDSTATNALDTVPVNKCYEYIKGKDTVTMRAVYLGNVVSGMLTYKLDGKDANKGTFTGDMKGSVLVGYYTFFAEGKQSVRQVAFRKNGTTLEEGYGNIYTNKDSAIFSNIDSLQYNNSLQLKETPCK